MAAQQKSENVPRTANLLACKQWWKVCFLHGSQEKYYRQVYGQAAAQRMMKASNNIENKEKESQIVFPTKCHSPVVIDNGSGDTFKLNNSPKNRKQKVYSKNYDPEWILPKSTVNILDDPFLFGIDHLENGSDSGIDAKSIPANSPNRVRSPITNQQTDYSIVTPPPRPPKSTKVLNSLLKQRQQQPLDNV